MSEETNRLLEAILITLQDQAKDIRQLKEDVRVLKEDVRILKEDVRVLKEEVQALNRRATNLEIVVIDLNARQKATNERLAELAQAVEKNTAQLREHATEIKRLAETVQLNASEIGFMRELHLKDIQDLRERVSRLESKVA